MKAAGLSYNQLEKVFLLWRDEEGYYLAFSLQTPDDVVERATVALTQIRDEGLIESVATKYLKRYQEE